MLNKRYPTKIVPPSCEYVFERERLFKLIEEKQTYRVIWVNGPPGAGKTIFIASLLKRQQAKFLWYRIDSSGNKWEDIFYFLTLAANKNYPWKKLKLPTFTTEYSGDIKNFARIFFRQLFASLVRESAIVLDNCQEMEKDADFSRLLQVAVDELPHGIQLICISRNRPNAVLRRLRINNELLEIGSTELKFNNLESRTFINKLAPQLTKQQIQQILSRTQGWAAGIVLMLEQFHKVGFTDNFDFNENISDYLISEIFSYIPKEHHKFLVSSALFTQFTPGMAIELTKYKRAKNYLDELVAKNFLIDRTACSPPSYSYHPLFRGALLDNASNLFTQENWQILQHKAAMILIAQNRPIEAMLLYQQLRDWLSLKNLLLQQAEKLIKMGRYQSVCKWIEALPVDYLNMDTWLNFWYAVALKPIDPVAALKRLEISYQKFIINKDIKGIYSAWQAAVESITVSMDDFSGLEVWMIRFDEIRKRFPACPSIEIKVRFYTSAVQALSFHDLRHPWLRSMVRISERILRITPIKIIRTVLSTQLAHYYGLTCQVTKLKAVAPILEASLNDDTLPVLPRIMDAYMLTTYKLYMGDADKGLEYSKKGLELSEVSGIHLFKGMLLANSIACHISNGDLNSAEKTLQKAIESKNSQQRMLVSIIDCCSAWVATLANEKNYALQQIRQTVQLAKLINIECSYVCALAHETQISAELEQWEKAEQSLSLLSAIAKDTNNSFNLIPYYLSDAWLAYLQQDQTRALTAMQQLLQILRAEQIVNFFGWRPEVLVPLCILAIENNIEKEFTVRLLKCIRPLSKPPSQFGKWPWPIRIFSFGSLIIETDGKPLEQSGKSQKKIIDLLTLIIVMGGRNVNNDRLGEILWPDADGDLARKSLETAVHRLRKLIGKEAVLFNAGMISLNDSYCWLDLWAFETTADELEHIFKTGKQQHLVIKLTDRILNLYKAAFLIHSDSGIAILKQDELLNKLNRLLDLAVNFHEQRRENERVCQLLIKALELRPLLEENYLRLMAHYKKLGQPDQALRIYQQCKRTLHEGFSIPLSQKIQSVAEQLVNS
ncbi:MAG: hypothetical protein H6936_02325 [Burkholderiales bacterium]|nr:hypothetical protein [Nitrosomonas sp.]MCP5273691.1 hypothetical protein [Burkholderiales bacterium]